MHLSGTKRIVIKVGSALIADPHTHILRMTWLASLVEDIANMVAEGKEIVLVSSGGVVLGRKFIEKSSGALTLEEKQAAFCCGQMVLINNWREQLAVHGLSAAQILLTIQDTETRRSYLNARNALDTLLFHNIIPIINENDAVTTRGLRFGDNDRLSARVAQMASADLLILLSDVDGLYTADPNLDPHAAFIEEVSELTPEIMAMGGDSTTNVGSGGMATKLEAAEIAVGSGCHMVIMQGREPHPLHRLQHGARCTWFLARENPISARKHWIASNLHPQGEVIVDAGAARALKAGNSLLPIGVKAISGQFDRGDAVLIKDETGSILGQGLSAFTATDAQRILGRRSEEIAAILGYAGRSELIHKDDLVIDA